MDFQQIDRACRPLPFWSWNSELSEEKTTRQIARMKDAGMGGFFIHARGGLVTEYLGDDWHRNVELSIQQALSAGMQPWIYDENGWPSGFGAGAVNGKGADYQQKYLKFENGRAARENVLYQSDVCTVYYEINPYYIDILNPAATETFIAEIYDQYYKKYGSSFCGFFTDEPSLPENAIPWSHILPNEYEKRYHEELLPRLPELFVAKDSYVQTRVRFWKMITELFSENYFRKIYEYCQERGLKLTGHLLMEEGLQGQLIASGAAMPHYEYFSIPGVDWLGRKMRHYLAWNQVTSAAEQLGKKQVLTESFAKCGHNISFDEMRFMIEQQYMRGINLVCQHLEGYSLAGLRKRDYPPALFYQQPWWKEYRAFIDEISRMGMILSEGKREVDVLLIHPQSSAWVCFDRANLEPIKRLNASFMAQIMSLEQKHIAFHLGDEILIERHAHIEKERIVIGNCSYSKVILPEHTVLLDKTESLLRAFVCNGGKIVTVEELDENNTIDNHELLYSRRSMPDGETVHYLLNPTGVPQEFAVPEGSGRIDISNGKLTAVQARCCLQANESVLLLQGQRTPIKCAEMPELEELKLGGEWEITEMSENVLLLDHCDYYFDEILQEQNGYVLNIQQRACDLERPVWITCKYHFRIDDMPEKLFLVCETPELYEIHINGKRIMRAECGWYLDEAFRKIDIRNEAVEGENEITLSMRFLQSAETYKRIKAACDVPSERNKLTYTMEIEPVFVTGDFAVESTLVEELENDACRVRPEFSIGKKKKKISLHQIDRQGFPFFAGRMTVKKEIWVEHMRYKFVLPHKSGINAVGVKINGQDCGTLLYRYGELKLSAALKRGQNSVELTFVNTLRNVLGPHHLEEGESYDVSPASFYKEKCVFCQKPSRWNENYCLVHMSLI